MDDYIYIIITNCNLFDFQSMVIKYKSWDKFIEDIQDINCTEFVKGTMNGKLHHDNTYAIIDFKDDFHAKYHYNDEFHKDSFVYACPVDKDHMEYVVHTNEYMGLNESIPNCPKEFKKINKKKRNKIIKKAIKFNITQYFGK